MNPNGQFDKTSPDASPGEHELEPPERRFQISLANEQTTLTIDEHRLVAAVQAVLEESSYSSAVVSLAVVDDPTIHRLNNEFLQHDYPTDVLSFLLEDDGSSLEGELVLSADTAARNAEEFQWPAHDELTLYAIHGTLHLVGYDDKSSAQERKMREAEARHLERLSIKLPSGVSRWSVDHGQEEDAGPSASEGGSQS